MRLVMTRLFRSAHLLLATGAIAMASFAANANAEIVLVNLDYNSQFSGNTMSGAAAVGNVGDIWNASPTFGGFVGTETPSGNTGGTAPFGPVELLDTTGALSGIFYQMTFVNDGTFGFNQAFDNLSAVAGSGAENLLRDYAFVGGADAGEALSFVISGLDTNTTYSLYLYGNGDALGQGAVWDLNGVQQTSAFDGTLSIDEGGEYVRFTFDSGANTSQSFSATHLTGGIAVNGFQLTTAVPEPSSAILLGLVSVGGMLRRRRK